NTLYFTRATHDRDNDLYMVDNKFGVHRLTDSMSQVKAQFVEPKHIEYTSRDLKIHALLYDAGGKRGAVYIHGGPDYQSMNTFNPTIQLLVQRGFTVIAPNYRGSTGYGRRFNHLNDGDLGGGDLIDVVNAKKVLGNKRVTVLGASYGGYLTMMCITKFPDEWCSAAAIVPFVNWFTEKQHEREVLKQYDETKMGSDEGLLKDRSPIFSVNRIRVPLLLLAGENDPRCPAEETLQVVEKLKELNIKAEYKVYGGEGHGFSKKENWVDSIKRTVDFLDANCV
ncbi:MAG: alpha/beta fold hydrolase, partial [Thermoprotei archaeon]